MGSVITAAVAGVLLVLSILIICVEGVAFDRNFYRAEYEKLNTAVETGVTSEQLEEATDKLLGYIQEKEENLSFATEIDGAERQYFSEREQLHMWDVRKLNFNAVLFMRIALPLVLFLMVLSYLISGRSSLMFKSAFFGMLGALAALAIAAIFAAIDFNSFWTSFHWVFFTNDLWLLDPAESLMIRMFSETFFSDMVSRILMIFLPFVGAVTVLFGVLSRVLKKKWEK